MAPAKDPLELGTHWGAAMNFPESPKGDPPKMGAANAIVRAIVLYGTPLFLAIFGVYLVSDAWGRGFHPGVRSFAGVLLPVVVASLLYVFSRGTLSRMASVPTGIGVIVGVVLGLAVMGILRLVGRGSAIPLPELMVSGCFSVLVFSTAAEEEDKSLAYYYGVMCGLLLYVIALGFPTLS